MKRYIKASYDTSMPKWLKNPTKDTKSAIDILNWEYAMSQAKFYKEPQPDSIPIHLLYEVYKKAHSHRGWYYDDVPEIIYLPDYPYVANDYFFRNGDKFRGVINSAKSKIEQHIAAV